MARTSPSALWAARPDAPASATAWSPFPHGRAPPLLIVRPNVSVSTGRAYQAIDKEKIQRKQTSKDAAYALIHRDGSRLIRALSNDFEPVLFKVSPILRETREELTVTGYPTLMTGSGSAFFVVVGGDDRDVLAKKLRAEHPEWAVEVCETGDELRMKNEE